MKLNEMFKENKRNYYQRLPVLVKILLLVLLSFLVILISSEKTLLLMFYLVFAVHLTTGLTKDRIIFLLVLTFFSLWGAMMSQGLFYNRFPKTEIFCLITPDFPVLGGWTGGVIVYAEGLLYGIKQGLRAAIMCLSGMLLCWNVKQKELLYGFRKLHFSPKLAFMLTAALRFWPVIADETQTVTLAQRLKKERKGRHILKMYYQTIIPVIVRSVRRSLILAMSVEARGFPPARQSNTMDFSTPEKLFLAFGIVVLAVLCILKLLGQLQMTGVFYLPSFHSIYDWIIFWM
ncbi:MAG: energy-coupling factor transporter transmembrane protein EcfT [Acidaminococcaceae bacterium]|nr:energy-coupling factor transporter transmembrane protein EcfT [Acidaminococcaceae bacterium]MBQ5346425.1 energy-coupling factor transporter transmembrane protein EcfT [Acidaminococcaceae bacterium]